MLIYIIVRSEVRLSKMKKYIEKQLGTRDKRLYYDFLPSMIEIIEKPANRLVSVIMYMCFALIATTIIWACFTRIDIVVTATGMVDTDNPLISLNYQTGGIISEVKFKEGDYVKEGDVICTLASEVNETTLKEYEYNLNVLNIQKEMYEKLYEKYRNDDYSTLDVDTSAYGENSKIADEIVMENEVFLKNLDVQDDSNIELLKKDRMLTVIQNINNIDVKMAGINTQLQSGKKNLEDTTIKSTGNGYLAFKDKLYSGKTVNAGDVVGYVTSENNEYRFTAYVMDEDITQLNINDTVKIKLSAYNDSRYEYVEGKIVHISDVPMNIEGKGMSYTVDIKLSEIPDNIKSGMEGSIDIIVGTRTVMDYFMEPFMEGLDDSLKEK